MSAESSDTTSLVEAMQPLHLLRPNDDHESLEEDAASMAALEKITDEVTVISVMGNQRGGKSTLMNLLHGRSLAGFQVGHYLDPKTAGLWVWPRPHPWKEGVTVLLVDSEGLDSPHIPQHYNWLLSAVTLLMSDVFMYQSRVSIEQMQTERLDMILRIADQLARGEGSEDTMASSGSTFLWLLRDHQLRMRRSPKDELFGKLDPSAARALQHCFKHSDCMTLSRPVNNDEDMQKLDQLSYEDLSADFREGFAVLERYLFDLVMHPRSILGRPTTGKSLAACMRKYLTAVQEGGGLLADIRQMPSCKNMLLNLGGDRAVQAGLIAYQTEMTSVEKASGFKTSEALLETHSRAADKAIGAFDQEASANGLDTQERAPFHEVCLQRIARWGPSVPLPDGFQTPSEASRVGLRMSGGMLEGGELLSIWQRHAQACQVNAFRRFSELRDSLESAVLPSEAEELRAFWNQVESATKEVPGAVKEALREWSCGVGDRLTLSLLRRDLATKGDKMQAEQQQLQSGLRKLEETLSAQSSESLSALQAVDGRLSDRVQELDLQFSRKHSHQQTEIEEAQKRSTEALSNARTELSSNINSLQQVLAGTDARLTSSVSEVRTEMRQSSSDASALSKDLHKHSERSICEVQARVDAEVERREQELKAVEQRGATAMENAEKRLSEATSILRAEQSDLASSLAEIRRELQTARSDAKAFGEAAQEKAERLVDSLATKLSQDTEKQCCRLHDAEQHWKTALDAAKKCSSEAHAALKEEQEKLQASLADARGAMQQACSETAANSEAAASLAERRLCDSEERLRSQLQAHQSALQATEQRWQTHTVEAAQKVQLTTDNLQQQHASLAALVSSISEQVQQGRSEAHTELEAWHEKVKILLQSSETRISDTLRQEQSEANKSTSSAMECVEGAQADTRKEVRRLEGEMRGYQATHDNSHSDLSSRLTAAESECRHLTTELAGLREELLTQRELSAKLDSADTGADQLAYAMLLSGAWMSCLQVLQQQAFLLAPLAAGIAGSSYFLWRHGLDGSRSRCRAINHEVNMKTRAFLGGQRCNLAEFCNNRCPAVSQRVSSAVEACQSQSNQSFLPEGRLKTSLKRVFDMCRSSAPSPSPEASYIQANKALDSEEANEAPRKRARTQDAGA